MSPKRDSFPGDYIIIHEAHYNKNDKRKTHTLLKYQGFCQYLVEIRVTFPAEHVIRGHAETSCKNSNLMNKSNSLRCIAV